MATWNRIHQERNTWWEKKLNGIESKKSSINISQLGIMLPRNQVNSRVQICWSERYSIWFIIASQYKPYFVKALKHKGNRTILVKRVSPTHNIKVKKTLNFTLDNNLMLFHYYIFYFSRIYSQRKNTTY